MSAPVTLHVCTTCRGEGDTRPGRDLLAALDALLAERSRPGLTVEAVECLSVCKRPCTVAVSSPGRWTYVWADLDLDPAASAAALLEGVGLYAGTADGIVPWRERPEILRKGVVARIPPLTPVQTLQIQEAAE